MATAMTDVRFARGRKIDVVRLALTGAIVAPLFFLLCWIGALLPVSPGTHMYLQLFTAAPINSATALVQGICWSFAFGLIAASLFALVYNLLAPIDRD